MKELDLVRLINEKPYSDYNLKKNMHGIIIDIYIDNISVLFFNPKNVGDYAIVDINKKDIVIEPEKIPEKIKKQIMEKIEHIKQNAKNKIDVLSIKEYDLVELIVEDEKYAKEGIHKGDKGCVMDDHAVQGYILVDFSGIDENGQFYGDCILVNIDDLKLVD